VADRHKISKARTSGHGRNSAGGTGDGALPPLTPRQLDVLRFVVLHTIENGFAPTLAEICAQLDLNSLATVHRHIGFLAEKGYIERDAMVSRRGLVVTELARKLLKNVNAHSVAVEQAQGVVERHLAVIRSRPQVLVQLADVESILSDIGALKAVR
jgi:DNA-binding MarR family transcriptional regulator